MTQEDKELLFKDLSARFPYRVKVQYDNQACKLVVINDDCTILLLGEDGHKPNIEDDLFLNIEKAKPYLRPMSSMTEEEKDEMFGICTLSNCSVNSNWEFVGVEIMSSHPRYGDHYSTDYSVIDWLNKNMFDYRGLIEKGLALEAPEDMYKH
jgi:hypothetical protein